MKKAIFFFYSIIFTLVISGCAGNKELQERAPAQFQKVYYTTGEEGLTLHIPVAVIQENQVTLEGVYFHGKRSALVRDSEKANLFSANFTTAEGMKKLSSDPLEENKNRVPQKPEKPPFEIEENEAILVFTRNGKTGYYKLTGIEEQK